MYISEIMEGLQGEGKYTGLPTTFIRTFGCNCNCSYCDTRYSFQGNRKKMSFDAIISKVQKLKNKYICITGGEPLLQNTEVLMLAMELRGMDYEVSIETNGTIPIEEEPYRRTYSYCMDIKCPSSGESAKNCYANLLVLQFNDEIKFVIATEEDYLFAKELIIRRATNASFILSPCFNEKGESNGKQIAEWLLRDKLPRTRLGIQVHKVLGIY